MTTALFPSQRIGDFTITAISDGYLSVGLDALMNVEPADALQMQNDGRAEDASAVHINCYVVRGRGRTILIDAGAGGFKQWGGRLLRNLSLAGLRPAQIDAVLLTHAHPDHVGGLIGASGDVAFPNAELVVHRREIAFWQDDGNMGRAAARARGNFLLARQVFDGYRDRLRIFDAGEVFPGIAALSLPGHTAGHTGYRLDAGDRSLLVWGDIVHFPQIQVPHPEVSIVFDHDPVLAVATRSRLLDLVSTERLLIAGMHFGELGFARIERTNAAYAVTYEA
ncbi:MBL fold metallo-hydrolase [Xanthomonas bundabergensis]|uniref:MBL fold metallo-hydrolase n=1 Tax=Xanthomonas bundabergensis TaxID=3160842 RepID=UPI003511513C